MLGRWLFYGLAGIVAEVFWTALANVRRRPQERWLLKGESTLWAIPIYGTIAPLFRPVHASVRTAPWWARGLVYMTTFFSVEYASGLLLRRLLGEAPWDYSESPFHVQGLIRLDYAPVWFAAGLAVERLDAILPPGLRPSGPAPEG